eukprot:scaffold1645_cov288-Pavlova_lutheri.AAC.7
MYGVQGRTLGVDPCVVVFGFLLSVLGSHACVSVRRTRVADRCFVPCLSPGPRILGIPRMFERPWPVEGDGRSFLEGFRPHATLLDRFGGLLGLILGICIVRSHPTGSVHRPGPRLVRPPSPRAYLSPSRTRVCAAGGSAASMRLAQVSPGGGMEEGRGGSLSFSFSPSSHPGLGEGDPSACPG